MAAFAVVVETTSIGVEAVLVGAEVGCGSEVGAVVVVGSLAGAVVVPVEGGLFFCVEAGEEGAVVVPVEDATLVEEDFMDPPPQPARVSARTAGNIKGRAARVGSARECNGGVICNIGFLWENVWKENHTRASTLNGAKNRLNSMIQQGDQMGL